VAVALGATKDIPDPRDLPRWLKGVNCYFCHNATEVAGLHNNPVELGLDRVLRAAITDPLEKGRAHDAEYGAYQDGAVLKSGDLCGSCHDIVTSAGVHLEQTYKEWLDSFYSEKDPLEPQKPHQNLFGQTCNNCHMKGTKDAQIADVDGAPTDRVFHEHRFVGLDVAVTDFPDTEQGPLLRADQLQAIEESRSTAICASLCVADDGAGGSRIQVWLHNESAGHHWPSGARQDRRAWAEVIAYDAADAPVWSSGRLAPGQEVPDESDPTLWIFRDWLKGEDGQDVHMFWEARSLEMSFLPVGVDFFGDPLTWQSRDYPSLATPPARVTLRLLLQPVGRDVIAEMVASGDLDPGLTEAYETYSVTPAELTWTAATATVSETGYGACVDTTPSCGSPFLRCGRFYREATCALEPMCAWVAGVCQPAAP
jgi:hypothetical protein